MENSHLWFSECRGVTTHKWKWNISVMKKLKNGYHFINIDRMEKFQMNNPQSLRLQFSECQWKWNISVSHYEQIEKWPAFRKC